MKLSIPIICVVALSLVVFIPDVSACSCSAEWSIEDDFGEAESIIFSGKVTDILEQQRTFLVTFEIDQTWKGMPNDITTIKTMTSQSSASCGYNFVNQQSYLVVTQGRWDQTPTITSCSSTTDLEFANEQISFLNKQSLNDYEVSKPPTSNQTFPPPLKQIKAGVALVDIKCNEGKYVVYKYSRMNAACVSLETEGKLLSRGWAAMRLGLPSTDNVARDLCQFYEGRWIEEYNQCENLQSEMHCSLIGGVYNECASACRNSPDYPNIACTDNCVQVCTVESSSQDKPVDELEESFLDKQVKIPFGNTIHFDKLELNFYDIQDSRCPLDVVCIWEGEVTAMIYVKNQTDKISVNFTLGDTISYIPPYKIILTDVEPHPISTKKPEYVATLSISKNQMKLQSVEGKTTATNTKPETNTSSLEIKINGEKQVRRGTTHTLEIQVLRGNNPVQGAQVFLDIEDYGENIIKEFNGYTNSQGYFIFSWEIPQSFDDIETLFAIVDATDDISVKTEVFKFQVYCLPGEENCKVKGN